MFQVSESQVKDFFSSANIKFANKDVLSISDLEYLFDSTIDLLSIPSPRRELKKYFIQPEIVFLFVIEIFNSRLIDYDSRVRCRDEFNKLIKKISKPKNPNNVKLRILDKGGNYPNCDLKRGDTKYTTINFLPILITKYKGKRECEYTNYSEVSWINRRELKVAICCILAPDSSICSFYFSDYNQIELNQDTLNIIPSSLQDYFLFELLQYNNRFKPLNQHYREREATPDVTAYRFIPFEDSIEIYNKLFDSFSIQHQPLMRTSNYLVKSYMLWQNRNFGEDAIANVMFCLEGCLRLMFKKYSRSGKSFNFKEVEDIFINLYPKGEELFSFIKEGYDKRISIVHAEPNWGADWSPLLFAEDYFDYFKICKCLLNNILIDRII